MKFYFSILILALPALSASASPLTPLKNEIKKDGYILYQTPLAFSGTGTLVGGTANAMAIVAGPQQCFPDVIDNQPNPLRYVDDTDLGSISQTTSFEGKAVVDLLKFQNTANSVFTIGVGGESIQTVELQFEGAKMESIDTVLLEKYYQHHMSEPCKKLLDKVGFIIQALRVDKMRYAFKNKSGAYLKLTTEGISEYFNIDLNIKYHIEQDYQLVIDTPKYIGYQLGRLRLKDNGLSLYRAQHTFFNHYLFRSVSIFQQ